MLNMVTHRELRALKPHRQVHPSSSCFINTTVFFSQRGLTWLTNNHYVELRSFKILESDSLKSFPRQLVGGFTPCEKYARQIGSILRGSGWTVFFWNYLYHQENILMFVSRFDCPRYGGHNLQQSSQTAHLTHTDKPREHQRKTCWDFKMTLSALCCAFW